jgi:hypothetical protein
VSALERGVYVTVRIPITRCPSFDRSYGFCPAMVPIKKRADNRASGKGEKTWGRDTTVTHARKQCLGPCESPVATNPSPRMCAQYASIMFSFLILFLAYMEMHIPPRSVFPCWFPPNAPHRRHRYTDNPGDRDTLGCVEETVYIARILVGSHDRMKCSRTGALLSTWDIRRARFNVEASTDSLRALSRSLAHIL